jgi:membrane protein YqaA with SNARE-associated domain
MTFFAVALGCVVGSFIGNVSVFWVIGLMAQRAEKKQEEQLRKLQEQFLEVRQKEAERMERYAKMEG